jgi:ATP-dependent RNA helicase DDX31/DBP7
MEEDGFISNITIGNVISRPKKSASDKKMEKKMKYLEKKQIRKQHKKKNENENNNPKRKIFNNESNKPKILIEEKKEKIFNKNVNVIKETEEEKEEKIIEDKHKDKEIKIENKKKEVKIVEENKKDKPIKNEDKKKEEKMIEENNKDKEIKIENIKKDKKLNEDNNNDNLIINESISNKNIKKEDNKKRSNTSQTIFSIKSFEDLQINPYLKKALNKNNYNIMTKIQKKAIPILLEHKNVIVKSETGSGKTLAYIIPLYQNLIEINDINKISRKDGIYSIIFSPTHELCLQIEKTLDKIKSCCINVVYGTMMGGQKVETEKKKLRKGLNIIITTPGRLLYHLKNTENLNFNKLKIIIIDEADLMLDMGFEKDIKECFKLIIKKTENEYNNVENIELNPDLFKKFKIYLISATIDNRIRKMSSYFMKGFKAIGFEKEDNDNNKKENNNEIKEDNIINHNNYLSNLKQQNITQLYSYIYDEFKLVHLMAFLYNNFQKKTIIFVSTCDLCEYLSKIITEIEININNNDKSPEKNINLFSQKTYKLHGKMKHEERKIVFNEFNLDNTGILIATDVASRGLDFQDVEWIIHYDINPDIKEYINRIGRTARIDNIGNSILFLMKNELKLLDTCFNSVKNNLNEMKNSDILINFVKNINKNILQTKIDENFSDIKIEDDVLDENEIYKKKYNSIINILIRCIKNFVFKNKNNLILARKAFKSEIRAYVTFFKYGKDVFNTNVLNLTRISRSFGLYKESTSMKVGDDQVNINYQIDRKEKYTQKKFLNKKIQNRLIYSEFE